MPIELGVRCWVNINKNSFLFFLRQKKVSGCPTATHFGVACDPLAHSPTYLLKKMFGILMQNG